MKTKPVITKVSKWGNGYGIRVPAAILAHHTLSDESEVVIVSDKDGITITPRVASIADVPLATLLAGVTPAQLRDQKGGADYFGVPQGREIW
jgi:antitoxin component of MazEF toxin-antitoxin module